MYRHVARQIEILRYIHHGHIHTNIICHGREQGRKGRGKKVQSDGCKVAQPKRVRLGHFVFSN